MKTKNGKALPLDACKVKGGNVEVSKAGIAKVIGKPAAGIERYVSHFSTCPRASEARKPKAETDFQATLRLLLEAIEMLQGAQGKRIQEQAKALSEAWREKVLPAGFRAEKAAKAGREAEHMARGIEERRAAGHRRL